MMNQLAIESVLKKLKSLPNSSTQSRDEQLVMRHIEAFLTIKAEEYLGVPLGDLKNNTYGISGQAYLVNESTIQITNFNLKEVPKLQARFAVSSQRQVGMVEEMYQVLTEKGGFKYLEPIDSNMTTFKNANLIVKLPASPKKEKWRYFGVVSENKWAYLAARSIDDKFVPKSFCCLPPLNGWIYNVRSEPIEIVDIKTLRIPRFSFDGNKAPDGWFFVGAGAVDKKNGQKCSVVGRDTNGLQCPLREKYKEQNLLVKLPGNLTLYDITWLSVYSYEVGVDFGHIEFKILKSSQPLPPEMPLANKDDVKLVKGWPVLKLVALPEEGKKFTDLTFTMGPAGGSRAKAFRGTCENLETVWYVQGMMQPEIWFQRGKTYRLKVFGGRSDPLYLSTDSVGGWAEKSENDKKDLQIFAGGNGAAAGDLCSYKLSNDARAKNPDNFDDFDEYSHFLTFDCPNRQVPYELIWTADNTNSTNDFYYGSYNQFYLGGRVRICDAFDGGATTMPKCIRYLNKKHAVN